MIYRFLVLFLMYSFIGWIMEVLLTIFTKHKFVNRGFLLGPICPIYGFGCMAITLFLGRYQSDPVVLVVMAMLVCSLIEYMTSYFMEKIFHARWWDYSDKKFNLNGRICLQFILAFGLLGSIVMYVINPFFNYLLDFIPSITLQIVSICLFVIYIIDNIISFNVIKSIKATTNSIRKDSTEEITKKVREILTHTNVLTRRVMDSFPNFSVLKEKTKERIARTKKEIKKREKALKMAEKELKKEKQILKKLNK